MTNRLQDSHLIEGGNPLKGDVSISGAKNSVLPILASCLLLDESVTLHNVPHLQDVTTFVSLLAGMGVGITLTDDLSIAVDASTLTQTVAPYDLVSQMRASVLVLGPLLSRARHATVALPGGCAIGQRPIDMHIQGLEAMGAHCEVNEGYIQAVAPQGLIGADIHLPFPTVTGTENLIMAAVYAKGTTRLFGAAQEPEVTDLVHFLKERGAHIMGEGSGTLTIEGVDHLQGGEFTILPDRIESGTYLVAAAMTQGDVRLKKTNPAILENFLPYLEAAGAIIERGTDFIHLRMIDQPRAVDIVTGPYPAFPTDMQAQFLAMNCVARGQATVTESIFENRFMHVDELRRMGADISVKGSQAVIRGGKLTGAPVRATDLRASACLVLAGLVAKGQTCVRSIHHIDRGYECIEEKLAQLGADIRRITESEPENEAHSHRLLSQLSESPA